MIAGTVPGRLASRQDLVNDADEPLIGAVVLNWNGLQDTLECIASLHRSTYRNIQIIVVDNASTDGSQHVLQRCHEVTILLRSRKNVGYAGGNNIGIRWALDHGAEYVWVLNNDTVVHPDAASHLIARMRQDPSIGICGSTLVYHDDRDTIQALAGAHYCPWTTRIAYVGQGRKLHERPNSPSIVESQLDYVHGAAAFGRTACLDAIGLMREDYFAFFEELDWASRLKGRFRLGWSPESVVFHKEGRTTGTNRDPSRRSQFADYYGMRNRILYTRRHHPVALPLVMGVVPIAIANRLLRRQLGHIPTLLTGAIDGLIGRDSWTRLRSPRRT